MRIPTLTVRTALAAAAGLVFGAAGFASAPATQEDEAKRLSAAEIEAILKGDSETAASETCTEYTNASGQCIYVICVDEWGNREFRACESD